MTFAVLGDIGQTANSVSTVNHIINKKNISMILHAGDLSYADCDQTLWDSYGLMIETLSYYTPWMVCPGNHEIEFNGTDYSNLFTAFETRYRMPYVKPANFGEVLIKSEINTKTGQPYCTPSIFQVEYNYGNSFFSFEAGLSHIIFLNSYTNSKPTSQQFIWLESNLLNINRSVTPWVIVVMHCPWYSSNVNHYADKQTVEMRSNMELLFNKYHVNIVFNGHVHDYERTYPVFMNKTDEFSTIYITIGNAGNLEGLDNKYIEQPKWSAFRNGTEYGFGTLTIINANTLFWKWYINDGKQMIPRDELLLCNIYYTHSDCFK
jgi:predicted phosphodiesterase